MLLAGTLGACASNGPLTGADRDNHGCIPSAGTTWSQVKQACVQPWEAGIRLNQTAQTDGAQFAAYVILSADGTQAEVFTKTGTQVLTHSFTQDGPQWSGKKMLLKRLPAAWELYENGALTYRAEQAQ